MLLCRPSSSKQARQYEDEDEGAEATAACRFGSTGEPSPSRGGRDQASSRGLRRRPRLIDVR